MEYIYNSPVGELLISYNGKHITGLHFGKPQTQEFANNSIIEKCLLQLDAYFAGNLKNFDLPLDAHGTDFQKAVWTALCGIEYGETATYGQIAAAVGNSKASRAVGGANNKNPIAIIIPCHRVIGASGKLVGYAGGMERKTWLLTHESNHL
ncbi:MAG: methylated-DNA--[protein]-cysteine S-methyltransferase [Defluviitaleaceae bacterium]|nr:methylated-DNA--[protein]-cysteine S-methyltransferase [Defluviitaleaceae bacterium]